MRHAPWLVLALALGLVLSGCLSTDRDDTDQGGGGTPGGTGDDDDTTPQMDTDPAAERESTDEGWGY